MGYTSGLEKELAEAEEIIEQLLNHLPDNQYYKNDNSWGRCWDELSRDAQDSVTIVRMRALEFIRLRAAEP